MTFPDQKFDSLAAFCDAYFDQVRATAESIDRKKLSQAARLLEEAYAAGASVYSCGNGGSAAISNHLVCDHLKGTRTDTNLKPRVVSLSSAIETITAIANDIAYDEIFSYQIESLGKKGDVLIAISSSGDSENIVRVIEQARKNGLKTIALTGFDGGRAAALADISLHVQGNNYGVVEDVHQSIMHILSQFIRQNRMNAPLIRERKF